MNISPYYEEYKSWFVSKDPGVWLHGRFEFHRTLNLLMVVESFFGIVTNNHASTGKINSPPNIKLNNGVASSPGALIDVKSTALMMDEFIVHIARIRLDNDALVGTGSHQTCEKCLPGKVTTFLNFVLQCEINDFHCISLLLSMKKDKRNLIRFISIYHCNVVYPQPDLKIMFELRFVDKDPIEFKDLNPFNTAKFDSFAVTRRSFQIYTDIIFDVGVTKPHGGMSWIVNEADDERDLATNNLNSVFDSLVLAGNIAFHSSDTVTNTQARTALDTLGHHSLFNIERLRADEIESLGAHLPEPTESEKYVVTLSTSLLNGWFGRVMEGQSDSRLNLFRASHLILTDVVDCRWRLTIQAYNQHLVLELPPRNKPTLEFLTRLSDGTHFLFNYSEGHYGTHIRHTMAVLAVELSLRKFLKFPFSEIFMCAKPHLIMEEFYAMVFSVVATTAIHSMVATQQSSVTRQVVHPVSVAKIEGKLTNNAKLQVLFFVKNCIRLLRHHGVLPQSSRLLNHLGEDGFDIVHMLPGHDEVPLYDFDLPARNSSTWKPPPAQCPPFRGATLLINPFRADLHINRDSSVKLVLERHSFLVVNHEMKYAFDANVSCQLQTYFRILVIPAIFLGHLPTYFHNKRYSNVHLSEQPQFQVCLRASGEIVSASDLVPYYCDQVICNSDECQYFHYPYCTGCMRRYLNLERRPTAHQERYGLATLKNIAAGRIVITDLVGGNAFFQVITATQRAERVAAAVGGYLPYVSELLPSVYWDQSVRRGLSSGITAAQSNDHVNCVLTVSVEKNCGVLVTCTAVRDIKEGELLCSEVVADEGGLYKVFCC